MTIRRHPEYYFADGNIVFLVEEDLFCVHRYFFVRESVVFRDMLSIAIPSGSTAEGLSDEKPIVLEQVQSDDFARLLWMFYNPTYTNDNASVEEWSSILELAHRWQFDVIRGVALKALIALPMDAVEKITLCETYDIPRAKATEAYVTVCTRKHPLTLQEGRRLGLETSIAIAHIRDQVKDLELQNSQSIWPDRSKEISSFVVECLVQRDTEGLSGPLPLLSSEAIYTSPVALDW